MECCEIQLQPMMSYDASDLKAAPRLSATIKLKKNLAARLKPVDPEKDPRAFFVLAYPTKEKNEPPLRFAR